MPKLVDLTKSPIGDWTVLSHIGGPSSQWLCRCKCGTVRAVQGSRLRANHSLGCGCEKKKRIGAGNRRHGHSAGGDTSLTYHSWRSMLARCSNPKLVEYQLYGGRGVTVHPPWIESFDAFLADLGPRPSRSHTLDRYPEAAGNYVPGNCRWATKSEQNNNRPGYNNLVTAHGKTQTLAEWSKESGIEWHTLKGRLNRGWPPERAVTVPVHHQPREAAQVTDE